jgi:hypothetical protein
MIFLQDTLMEKSALSRIENTVTGGLVLKIYLLHIPNHPHLLLLSIITLFLVVQFGSLIEPRGPLLAYEALWVDA